MPYPKITDKQGFIVMALFIVVLILGMAWLSGGNSATLPPPN